MGAVGGMAELELAVQVAAEMETIILPSSRTDLLERLILAAVAVVERVTPLDGLADLALLLCGTGVRRRARCVTVSTGSGIREVLWATG